MTGPVPPLGALADIPALQSDVPVAHVDLARLAGGRERLAALPFTLRILLENAARTAGEGWATREEVERLAAWKPGDGIVVPVRVSRVILPDSSGLPTLMDLAALREELARRGADPLAVQPRVPVDLVVDHSVMVDHYGSRDALSLNVGREYERNRERYRFFKWVQGAFDRLRVVPPGMGIVHQVHIERLARVVDTEPAGGRLLAYPEFVLGGDSHTTMVNGLGVLAWGVGGIEAEAAMLGQPYIVPVPKVVGVRLSGSLREGTTTTDLVLHVTQRLREVGVVGAFVEFTGPSYGALSVPDRATIANMAPEYGATASFFPVDANTIAYLRQTGREEPAVALVEAYCRAAGFWRDADTPDPAFDMLVEIDLGGIATSVAGPRRPQDRHSLGAVPASFRDALARPQAEGGFGLTPEERRRGFTLEAGDRTYRLEHGAIAIAAITACTNTSNPAVMLAAGLLARNAVARGLRTPAYVKTSMAPGSRVVSQYLHETGLLEPLEALGFHVVGYGCTTCSGKSGPLPAPMAGLIEQEGMLAAAVVSSNRNFEGRIHRQIRAAYLASPPLVVAYALAGRIDIDLETEPLGRDRDGSPVFLRDLWPRAQEIDALIGYSRDPAVYRENYARLFDGTEQWRSLDAPAGVLFPWDRGSTYILEPPFFAQADADDADALPETIENARVLGVFGDHFNTDHISPAGEIPRDSEAGRYLAAQGVAPDSFNAYTMRRGNHHVMTRGTFSHARTVNRLVPDRAGGHTLKFPERRVTSIFEAAEAYRAENTPVIVLGGRDYGAGSSRDWAAKGPRLLGVRCVVAESFERIHRSNLVALGIVPLRFRDGETMRTLGLDGSETYTIEGLRQGVAEGGPVRVLAAKDDGGTVSFAVEPAIVSTSEVEMLRGGGIFTRVLRKTATAAPFDTAVV